MSGTALGTSCAAVSRTPQRRANREEEMYLARARQQELLDARAKELATLKQQQRNEEVVSKVSEPGKKNSKKKPAKSSETLTNNGYNPMQPWSSSSGGASYRPSRRTTNRG
jgi:hypothetical protein